MTDAHKEVRDTRRQAWLIFAIGVVVYLYIRLIEGRELTLLENIYVIALIAFEFFRIRICELAAQIDDLAIQMNAQPIATEPVSAARIADLARLVANGAATDEQWNEYWGAIAGK